MPRGRRNGGRAACFVDRIAPHRAHQRGARDMRRGYRESRARTASGSFSPLLLTRIYKHLRDIAGLYTRPSLSETRASLFVLLARKSRDLWRRTARLPALKYLCRYVVRAGRRAGKRRLRQYHVAARTLVPVRTKRPARRREYDVAWQPARTFCSVDFIVISGPDRVTTVSSIAVLKSVRWTQDPSIFLWIS